MTKICPICKTETDGPEKFCKECGEELVDKELYVESLPDLENGIDNNEDLTDDVPNDYKIPISQIIKENSPRPAEEYGIRSLSYEDNPLDDEDFEEDELEEYSYVEDEEIIKEPTNIKEDNEEEYTYLEDKEIEKQASNNEDEEEVEEIIETMNMEESKAIYPIHTTSKNPYAKDTESDLESINEFIDEKDLEEKKTSNRFKIRKPRFKLVHKQGAIILLALIIIAICATFTFNYINENSLNYINPTNEPGEYSNKIITFRLPVNWEEINSSEPNVIGSYRGSDHGNNIILSVYQSKDSDRSINEIKNSTEELDKRSGASINRSEIKRVNGIEMYDVISEKGTNNYSYRTFGFIKDNKEYGFLFISEDINAYSNEIEDIEKSIKYLENNNLPF